MSISTKKKKVKLTGGNGDGKKEKNMNAMSAEEAKIRAKAKIHIHIYVLEDGKINVWGPVDKPDIFRETLFQAAHIMEEKWAKAAESSKEEKKVIELKPNIVIARK